MWTVSFFLNPFDLDKAFLFIYLFPFFLEPAELIFITLSFKFSKNNVQCFGLRNRLDPLAYIYRATKTLKLFCLTILQLCYKQI